MDERKKDRSTWAVGGGVLLGIGVGFFFLHASANITLDKSNRKHEETQRIDARTMESHHTISDQDDDDHLTDHGYELITKQMQLSKNCRVLRYNDKTFLSTR